MKLGNTLTSLGLCELPQDASIDGFNKTIIFMFRNDIAQLMQNKFSSIQRPECTVIRGGYVSNKGGIYIRQKEEIPMPYSLLYFDERNERYQCIQDQTRKSIRGILGNTSRYFIGNGKVFTAAKYFDAWKKRQDNPNYINLNSL